MIKTMKAAVVHEFGKPLTIEEVPVPAAGPGQILVKIAATGVCHTDLHAAEGDWPVKPKPPFIPGHEGVGHVVAVGAGVRHVKEGDRVGVPWLYTACGHCRHCLGGWETLCEQQQNTGYSVNGGFAEYVVADPDYVGHLPANVSVRRHRADPVRRRDRLQRAQGHGHQARRLGRGLGHRRPRPYGGPVREGDGPQRASRSTSTTPSCELARKLGASLAVNARKADPVAFVKKEVGGAQGVLVTAVSPKAFEQAHRAWSGRGGTVSLVGLPPGDFPLSIFDTVLNGITVRGSIVGTRLDLQEALDFAGQGKVKATVATERLENINEIFARMHAGDIQGRIVIDFKK